MTEIEEIRKRYDFGRTEWKDVYDEYRTDQKYRVGDVWTADEKRERSEPGRERPMLYFDETTQNLNQLQNSVRSQKRAIKVTPEGNGADDKSSELRANLIRGIEYKSRAQDARIYAFDCQTSGGVGYTIIGKRYIPGTWDQELFIDRVLNPENIILDPGFKKRDASDMRWAFEIFRMEMDEFKQQYPNADPINFSDDNVARLTEWYGREWIQLARYWEVEITKRKLYLVKLPDGELLDIDSTKMKDAGQFIMRGKMWMNTGQGAINAEYLGEIQDSRNDDIKTVTFQLVTGREILGKVTKWDGNRIPIVPYFGPEIWVDKGMGPRRRFQSLIRSARDPIKMLCYQRSKEAELLGKATMTVHVGYVGQFATAGEDWAIANKANVAFLQADPVVDGADGQVLPLPRLDTFNPGTDAIQGSAEAARRGIQAAMGGAPLPTQAQSHNEKSGVALKEIQQTFAIGTFGHIDNYESSITAEGDILNGLLDATYDTERDVPAMLPDETVATLHINGPGVHPVSGEKTNYQLGPGTGTHGVTISTGPNSDSQRENANEFVQSLMTPEMLAAALGGNPKAMKIVGQGVRQQNGGPLVDEIAEAIDPKQDQATAAQQLQQVQAELQKATQVAQALNAHAQEVEKERDEAVNKLTVQKMKGDQDLAKVAAQGQIDLLLKTIDVQQAEQQRQIDGLKFSVEKAIQALGMKQAHLQQETDRTVAQSQFDAQREDAKAERELAGASQQ